MFKAIKYIQRPFYGARHFHSKIHVEKHIRIGSLLDATTYYQGYIHVWYWVHN